MDLSSTSKLLSTPGPILVTGHTGFKGTWLTMLLESLGVEVVGLSLPPEQGSLYERLNRQELIPEILADIRDERIVRKTLNQFRPSSIIHLAAQPLVSESYKSPKETFETNVLGTLNILDEAFQTKFIKSIIVATTDKVYKNDESGKPYSELDSLAGKDPYSASKVAAESVVTAWQQLANVAGGPSVATVRSGNVIGGGDFSKDRLMPDLIRGFMKGAPVEISSENSSRPWQHVLDPLYGYLLVLDSLLEGRDIRSMNFGPIDTSLTVGEVSKIAAKGWGQGALLDFKLNEVDLHLESKVLNLDSRKARVELGWTPVWNQIESVNSTIEWWKKTLQSNIPPKVCMLEDVSKLLTAVNHYSIFPKN
jgi:CDP-glucose 4,6-dehydratase